MLSVFLIFVCTTPAYAYSLWSMSVWCSSVWDIIVFFGGGYLFCCWQGCSTEFFQGHLDDYFWCYHLLWSDMLPTLSLLFAPVVIFLWNYWYSWFIFFWYYPSFWWLVFYCFSGFCHWNFFCVICLYRFGVLDITIVPLVFFSVFIMYGSATLGIATSFSPSEFYICSFCTVNSTVLKISARWSSTCVCRVFIFVGIPGCGFCRVCTRYSASY